MSFHARDVANMTEADRAAFLASLTPTEAEDLQYDWSHWARPDQRIPDGDWINWLILAGRGTGKTRVGSETVRRWVKRYQYVNLIGATVDALTEDEAGELQYNWSFWARPEQRLPDGEWINWLILAGRGMGKTRVGAETVRQWVKRYQYVNLIGATADDVRTIMIEGESGILAICPPDERPKYIANKRELHWPNGNKSLLFSAEEPDRLRGKQHEKLWCDELAAWRYPDAWDQAAFGLRLGDKPQTVITTRPRPMPIIKGLIKDSQGENAKTFITRGSTFDNIANLADSFIHAIVKKYEGTRLGR